jgi:7-cyano-7-deazaguanine synthase
MKKAVVLFSGGLDSTTVLAIAKNLDFEICALSFSYKQRHEVELIAAKNIAKIYKIKEHKIAKIDLRIFGASALTSEIKVPKHDEIIADSKQVPITYVPARNTIFLSYALAYAEVVGAFDIFIGVNAIDYSGYPDCRPQFIEAFEKLASFATVASINDKRKFKIHAPLMKMNKKEIIQKGNELGVDYSKTHSCYDPIIQNKKIFSCGKCDSCKFRLDGFKAAGLGDEIKYL